MEPCIFQNRTGLHCEAFLSPTASLEAILFLHGYPAHLGSKNRDIAKHVHMKAGLDCYILHYPGLGNSVGHFSFRSAIDLAGEFAHVLFEKYSRVHLFGHSFGGLVAMEIAARSPRSIGAVCLASPFNFFPEGEALKSFAEDIYSQTRAFVSHLTPEQFREEVEYLAAHYNPRQKLPKLDQEGKRYLVFQAKRDEEVPCVTTAEFVAGFSKAELKYVELDTDHSFTELRTLLSDQFAEFLADGK